MIEQGVLEDPHVDAAFGLHVVQGTPLGKISVRPGPALAAADRFTPVIHGKGGHGAHPRHRRRYVRDRPVGGSNVRARPRR
jgi:amidohydrolase